MTNLSEIVLLIVLVGGIGALVWYIFSVTRTRPVTGAEALVGAKGVVWSETLTSDGEVSIDGVIWKARLANPNTGPMKKGEAIIVKSIEDITLVVGRNTVLSAEN